MFSTPRFDLFDTGRVFIVPENKHFYFHGTRQVEPFMFHCLECLSAADFYQLL